MPMKIDHSVLVVGAGLAGLTTAFRLHQLGVDSVVLESADAPGGRIRTVRFSDGMTAEAGMEEFWQGGPVYPLLRELGLELLEDRAHSSVILGGALHQRRGDGDRDEYLDGVFDRAERRDFLAFDSVVERIVREPGSAVGLRGVSLQALVHEAVGRGRVADWIRVVVESETAVEWSRIGALDGLAELRQFRDTPDGYGESNAHVHGGNAGLIDALVSGLPDGSVHTGITVTRIADGGDHVAVGYVDREGRPGRLRAGQVVVTVPAWSLGAIALDIRCEGPFRQAISTVRAGSYVKVVLRVRSEARSLWSSRGPGLFTLISDAPVGCVYLTEDPAGNDDVVTLLVHGEHARRLAGLPGPETVGRVTRHLEQLIVGPPGGGPRLPLMPGISRMITDGHAFDHQQAVAFWPVRRWRSRFDALAESVRRPHGRVHFGGDTTECSHSDGAVRSAERVVGSVCARVGATAAVA